MAMRRGRHHRSGDGPSLSDDDDDDDDAFSAFSRKKKKSKTTKASSLDSSNEKSNAGGAKKDEEKPPLSSSETKIVDDAAAAAAKTAAVAGTSSNKRHHGAISGSRKAKMDALLVELEAERKRKAAVAAGKDPRSGGRHRQQQQPNSGGCGGDAAFVPEKKGSFVEPGLEHLTTNLFVGNLAPSITEEEMTDLFRQFGDLFSVKIMWPRTQEERSRNRHSGFVCFVNRNDAEDAMAACDETDPFNVGRRIMIRWGKNVKNASVSSTTIIRRRTKKPPPAAAAQQPNAAPSTATATPDASGQPATSGTALSEDQVATAIRVVVPQDPQRLRLISTVASFVAKDGALFEQALLEREGSNLKFEFLRWNPSTAPSPIPSPNAADGGESGANAGSGREEHIFYRWRVYSFCQGDTLHSWRVEPFVMVEGGRAWIPPPLDAEAARREEEAERAKEESILRQKQERKFRNARRDYMTGRQLEQIRKGGPDGGARLDPADLAELDRLFRRQLCASREAICEAMAFCFERSGAAKQVSSILEELLVDASASVEKRIARLYLLSDVLFNSQQPGVKNAFLYRDAVERMAPAVFASLGRHGDGRLGRMTMNKLVSAVRTVLNAWTDWNVFNPNFLEELFARFEGREIPDPADTAGEDDEGEDGAAAPSAEDKNSGAPEEAHHPVREVAQGTWTTVPAEEEEEEEEEAVGSMPVADKTQARDKKEGEATANRVDEVLFQPRAADADAEEADGEPLDEDADGEPLEDDDDGEPLEEEEEEEEEEEAGDADGLLLEEAEEEERKGEGGKGNPDDDGDDDDADGVPLEEGEEVDAGAPFDEDDDVDGEPL